MGKPAPERLNHSGF